MYSASNCINWGFVVVCSMTLIMTPFFGLVHEWSRCCCAYSFLVFRNQYTMIIPFLPSSIKQIRPLLNDLILHDSFSNCPNFRDGTSLWYAMRILPRDPPLAFRVGGAPLPFFFQRGSLHISCVRPDVVNSSSSDAFLLVWHRSATILVTQPPVVKGASCQVANCSI